MFVSSGVQGAATDKTALGLELPCDSTPTASYPGCCSPRQTGDSGARTWRYCHEEVSRRRGDMYGV